MTGRRLGVWTLGEPVGRGAMGTVYRATDEGGRVAAVKVLSPELTNDELFRGRFAREAEALRQLDHPHIVMSYESGVDGGAVYLAMEFVDGPNYERRLQERGRLPWVEALAVGRQVADALKHAHDRGVIHRDLKPANILAVGDPDGPDGIRIKLTDFGVAKIFASAPLTAAGSFVGTAAYLAPEQAAGKPPAKRGDFYSLGCVLYALVVGRPPFVGESVTELIHQHRFAQPEQPVRLVPDLPHDLNALVMNLLEKEPAKRPADASVLIRQIDRIAGKLERQGRTPNETLLDPETDPTVSHDIGDSPGPGPATIAAEFVRAELHRQNRGGPVARFLNHPAVLVSLLLLCLAGIGYGLLRPQPTAEQLIESARPLMQSDNPADWQRAGRDYLGPLGDRYPNHKYRDEVAAFQQRVDDAAEQQKAVARLKREPSASAAEVFYRRGLRLLNDGQETAARREWANVVRAFDGIAGDERWVKLARDGLASLGQTSSADRGDLRAALQRVQRLREQGKNDDANAIFAALEALYRDDPEALEQIRRAKPAV
jgi:serine/threonine protein kinase